jgi:hypothetical protein
VGGGDGVYGGYASSSSSSGTATATASNNIVTISDGTVSEYVYGGYAESYSSTGTATATASNNTVTSMRIVIPLLVRPKLSTTP